MNAFAYNKQSKLSSKSYKLGAGGGIISMAITYPLVAISSRLQVQNMNNGGKDGYRVMLVSSLPHI